MTLHGSSPATGIVHLHGPNASPIGGDLSCMPADQAIRMTVHRLCTDPSMPIVIMTLTQREI